MCLKRLVLLEYLFKLCEEKYAIIAWPLLVGGQTR